METYVVAPDFSSYPDVCVLAFPFFYAPEYYSPRAQPIPVRVRHLLQTKSIAKAPVWSLIPAYKAHDLREKRPTIGSTHTT